MPKRLSASDSTDPQNDTVSPLPSQRKKPKHSAPTPDTCFVGKPIPPHEARAKWPHRYPSEGKKKDSTRSSEEAKCENSDVILARCHYSQAKVDGVLYNLHDSAYVKGEEGKPDYIARIVEMFETVDKEQYFTAQWFYRAEDTVIKSHGDLVDKKRLFISDSKDENPLDCIVSKLNIVMKSSNVASFNISCVEGWWSLFLCDFFFFLPLKKNYVVYQSMSCNFIVWLKVFEICILQVDLTSKKGKLPSCDYYYDMRYTEPYRTFSNLVNETVKTESDESSTISTESGSNACVSDANLANEKTIKNNSSGSSEWALLDLYSGCGAMSTGLCLGASLAGIKLVTRWAVDINAHACRSLKLNHSETQVRNEPAEDFLNLIKAWAKLCDEFALLGSERLDSDSDTDEEDDNEAGDVKREEAGNQSDLEEFEVEKFLAVRYGDPDQVQKPGLYFKVRWLGYGSSYDTWEPMDGLSGCKEIMRDFVTKGYKKRLLPLPGDAHFICGGPPCQGVSGFNRFRNAAAPLEDIKNKQLLVYMDIIDFLKPKYVLMENVVDILKFSGGYLGRYAIGRLVAMNYQARMGIMAAGSYGLPQFRMRVFLWGARPTEKLPQYPLPTHEVVSRGSVPTEFEETTVGYDKKETRQVADALLLEDAISDLPPVTNDENQDERNYGVAARTEFQKYIRLKRNEMVGSMATAQSAPRRLYDHRPLQLNKDDYDRVCRIPHKKGANFRDLPGVLVKGNKVEWDPSVERVMLDSGKPLVPDYAMTFVRGTSSKPFGRLWWDEIVPTVVTRAEPHNQVILHPTQNRVLTIRENARLQGFPDCYKLCGSVKERYIQVGNAVAVPVALALGYTFGMACQGLSDDNPLTTLPFKYPTCLARSSLAEIENNNETS